MSMSEVDRSTPPIFDYDRFELPENVSLSFRLNPHKSPDDLPDPIELGVVIRAADVVIVEFVSDDSLKSVVSEIARGNEKAFKYLRELLSRDEQDFGDWMQAFASALYATRTPALNIDVDYTHPSLQESERAKMHLVDRFARLEARPEERPEVGPALGAWMEGIRQRDQAILGNIKPTIESLIGRNRKLAEKRKKAPINIEVFYGGMHRSVLDAVVAKNGANPVEGFSASLHPDSSSDINEELYAMYLREQEIAFEIVQRHLAYIAISGRLITEGVLSRHLSGRALMSLFLASTEGLDLTDFRYAYGEVKDRILAKKAED